MLAFCPGVPPSRCGLPSSSHRLSATSTTSKISTSNMRYKRGESRYDACYYEITFADDAIASMQDLANGKDIGIFAQITKKQNVRVHVYAARDRMVEKYVDLNASGTVAKEGSVFQIDVANGLLIIAYPDENTDSTSFEFTYSLRSGADDLPIWSQEE